MASALCGSCQHAIYSQQKGARQSSRFSTSGLRRYRRSRHSAAFFRTMGRTLPVISKRCTSAARDSANSLPPTA